MTSQYLALYLEEARELWEEGRTAFDQPDAGGQDAFLRVAHTLKGMSGTMGYKALSDTFHALETAAKAWPPPPTVRGAWQAVGTALDAAAAQQAEGPLQGFVAPALGGDAPSAAAAAPAAAPADTAPATPAELAPGQWVRLSVAAGEPMPRARLTQWHQALRRAGVREISPSAAALTDTRTPADGLVALLETPAHIAAAQRLPSLDQAVAARHDEPAPAAAAAVGEPAGQTAPAGATESSGPPPSQLLRVDLRVMDALFDEVGQLHTHLRILASTGYGSNDWEREMREVQALVTRGAHRVANLRLSSLAPLMSQFERAARSAAEQAGKEIQVISDGGALRIAREVVERLRPLLPHIARNAVVHGIEDGDERAASGKPLAGTVRFFAHQEGSRVILTIQDDGAGVDVGRLRQKARDRGIDVPDDASEEALLELLFLPGFSTKAAADDLAGRGIGLDAVREAVELAGGRVRIASKHGAFFRMDLEIPVPLSLQQVVQVEAGDAAVGILDLGWEPAAETDGATWMAVPGLPEGGTQVLAAGELRIRVERYRKLGHVHLHQLRPPLNDMPGAIGFFLDAQGAPRVLCRIEPRAAP